MSDSDYGSVEKYYSDFYRKMIGYEATGLLSILWKYPHKVMEKPFKSNKNLDILELGVGEGEHIQFVTPDYRSYTAVDLDGERLKEVEKLGFKNLSIVAADASSLPFPDQSFDRVIATCLIAHIYDVETTIREWQRVLRPGGAMTIYIPCEPGLALKVFRRLFTQPKAEKMGYRGYELFIARDHVTAADRICFFLLHSFRNLGVDFKFRPFPVRSWYLNLFLVAQITKPSATRS